MSDITKHPTSIYFRLDLTGPSTRQMRNEKKIRRKYRSNESGYRDDNGAVAFGEAFKRFVK